MKKAIIFDMDGVIIDSESVWETYEKAFSGALFGKEICAQLQDTAYGGSIQTIYEQATSLGFAMEEAEYRRRYNEQADTVYAQARIADGMDEVMNYLAKTDLSVGLVTASPKYWIELTMKQCPWRDMFDCVVSIDEERLPPKPDPAGYTYAFRRLNILSKEALVIEDSNTGIAAAKAAGAYTIGLRQHLPPRYVSGGADRYIEQIRDILPLLRKGTI